MKTVTRALALIAVAGTNPAPTIFIVGGTGVTVSAGETFPLTIPANVTVTTKTGPVTVQVPSGKAGFVLDSPTSTLTSATGALLTITTTVTANGAPTPPTGGTNGIQVGGTATSASTTISNVTVTGMLDDGILIGAGSVAIGPGVTSSSNGILPTTRNGFAHDGLHVVGAAAAAVITGSGAAPTMFNANSAHGIFVGDDGSITLTGAPISAVAGTGTVVTNSNSAAGVWIQQTPSATAPPPNSITGLVSWGNFAGNGMRIVAGSNVTVRGSAFLSNNADGVIISTNPTRGNANDSNISLVDLGDGTTAGGNTFQGAIGEGANGNAGLCLAITPNLGETLQAVGNIFRGNTCASAASTLLLNNTGCGNSVAKCAGGICDLGFGRAQNATTPNAFNVSMCTQ